MDNAIPIVFSLVVLIFSVVIHEVSHGFAALALGDKTAQYAGRLTLNPLKHLDVFGSFLLPVISYLVGGFIFGWARPVPYNPDNLRNKKWGSALVALAGPAANIILAVFFGLLIRFSFLAAGRVSAEILMNFISIAGTIVLLNLVLAFFNLIPIPPLDGSKLLFAALPYQWNNIKIFLEQYGFYLLLIFIFFFANWLLPLVFYSFQFLVGSVPFL